MRSEKFYLKVTKIRLTIFHQILALQTPTVYKKYLNLSQDSAKKIRFELRCLREIEIGNE